MNEPPRPDAFHSVLCGVDGSEPSMVAVRQAVSVAAEGARLWALSAWDPTLGMPAGLSAIDVMHQLRDESRSALRHVTEAFPSVTPVLMRGRDVASLLAGVSNFEADLVAVGSHGTPRALGAVLGSVASAMAHYAPCSVLIARDSPAGDFPRTIVHADDGSPESLDAASVAGDLASRHGSRVLSLHVGDEGETTAIDAGTELIRAAGVNPEPLIARGSPAKSIVEVAQQQGASLIVVGSRGRTGLAALGSVSERVVHHASCSVLVVRRALHPAEDHA